MNKPTDPRAGYITIASRAFASDGYAGTSLAALAREAGVTKQALLHFFGTKEALYAAALDDLAARLMAQIAAAKDADPAKHLLRYFLTFQADALRDPQDVSLVVRALLDSRATARRWPLKPYLDKLADIARRTPGARDAGQDAVLAWLSQVIGMVQYLTISTPAVAGMYGTDTAAATAHRAEDRLRRAIADFTGVADGTGF
ncbi:MAG: helix-turn-helix domain-containing protein [Pseudomonadota bacterium]